MKSLAVCGRLSVFGSGDTQPGSARPRQPPMTTTSQARRAKFSGVGERSDFCIGRFSHSFAIQPLNPRGSFCEINAFGTSRVAASQ
jgi:hypothetical protein